MTARRDARRWAFLRNAASYVRAYNSNQQTRELEPAATRRQCATALEILRRLQSQRGLLLADDVGLGKTTVAAIVACVVAAMGCKVRVLAPNAPMARRWHEELSSHVQSVRSLIAGACKVSVHERERVNMLGGRIIISTHRRNVGNRQLHCDLLIVDEAHRAKSEHSLLAKELKASADQVANILILTATPFSIDVTDLCRMLEMVGGYSAQDAVRDAAAQLHRLWAGSYVDASFSLEVTKAIQGALEKLRPWVIRHSVEALSAQEKRLFGKVDLDWTIPVSPATSSQLEILLRADRLLSLAKQDGSREVARTNDPRFHVGWTFLEEEIESTSCRHADTEEAQLVQCHRSRIAELLGREQQTRHPKMNGVVTAIQALVKQGERVVVFCDHHKTAGELAVEMAAMLRPARQAKVPTELWLEAWQRILQPTVGELSRRSMSAFTGFLQWISSPGVCAQVARQLGEVPPTAAKLATRLERTTARRNDTNRLASEALSLWRHINSSPSLVESMKSFAGSGRFHASIPGAALDDPPLVAVCDLPKGIDADSHLFRLFHRSRDLVLALFNSPFGPDVLITTDQLSEGFDLHRYCRHIIHYELDPSPVRTVQRNGRLRRVQCWAARSGLPLRIAIPAFQGTRDERLVAIMHARLKQFDLLLGGIGTAQSLLAETGDSTHPAQSETLLRLNEALEPSRDCFVAY